MSESAQRRRVLNHALLAAWLVLFAAPAAAETLRYELTIPDRETVTFRLDLEVRHPGPLSARAEWTGGRRLSLKLTPPGQSYGALLRAGPSPLVLETSIERQSFEPGTWTLKIYSLAGRGGGTGTLVLDLPEESPSPAAPSADETLPVAPVHAEPWMRHQDVPSGTPASWLPLLDATEAFRAELLGDGSGPPADVCRWQVPFMEYLEQQRQRLLAGGTISSRKTAKFLGRVADAIGTVEGLRSSEDPLINGPRPDDPGLADTWLKLRTRRINPIEDELDALLNWLQRGRAPELDSEDWPRRMVSCLTACERFFEQRARVGERRAGNRELALAQWPRLLVAGDALAALAELPARRPGANSDDQSGGSGISSAAGESLRR